MLSKEQKELRRRILEISYKNGLSHLGSCLSCVDLICAVFKVKRSDEKFILSNGHAGIALYAVLERFGMLNPEKTDKLHIHPDRNPKWGIDASTGSLGQGLPIAVGMALADRSKNVYCSISDGECAEGSIWESLRIASGNNLTNLKILLNANGWGAYGRINTLSLKKRIETFDIKVILTNGHNTNSIVKGLKTRTNRPLLIFAKTKVNQFGFLKGLDAHYYVLNEEDYYKALNLLK